MNRFILLAVPGLLILASGCSGKGGPAPATAAPAPTLSTPTLNPSDGTSLLVPFTFPAGTDQTGLSFSGRVSINSGDWQTFQPTDSAITLNLAHAWLEVGLDALKVPELAPLSFRATASMAAWGSASPLSNTVQFTRALHEPVNMSTDYFASTGQMVIQASSISALATKLVVEGSALDALQTPLGWTTVLSQGLTPLSTLGLTPLTVQTSSIPNPNIFTFFVPPPPEGQPYLYRSHVETSTAASASVLGTAFTIPLLPPTPVVATAQATTITLNWQNQSSSATGIQILRVPGFADNLASAPVVATLPPTSASYVDTPPDSGYYTYQVVAATATQTAGGPRVTACPLSTAQLNGSPQTNLKGTTVFRRPTGEYLCLLSNLGLGTLHFENADTTWSDHTTLNPLTQWCGNGPQVDNQGNLHLFYASPAPKETGATWIIHEWLAGTTWQWELAGVDRTSNPSYQVFQDGSNHFYLLSNSQGGNLAASFQLIHGQTGLWASTPLLSPGGNPVVGRAPVACVGTAGDFRVGYQSNFHSYLLTLSTSSTVSESPIPDGGSGQGREALGLTEGTDGTLHLLLGSTAATAMPVSHVTYTTGAGWSAPEAIGGLPQALAVPSARLQASPSGARLLWLLQTGQATYLATRGPSGWNLTHLDSTQVGLGFVGEKAWLMDLIPAWYPSLPATYFLLSEP